MTQQEFLGELEQQLLIAARKRHQIPNPRPRHRTRGAFLVAAACVVTVLVGASLFRDTAPAAAIEVIVDDTSVTLMLKGDDVDPDAIVDAAAEANLDVQVVEVPVGPSNVGRFVRDSATELPPEIRLLDGDGGRFAGFEIPRDWTGTLRLALGRAAAADERYVAASDAAAPGEPLECESIVGTTLAESVAELQARGFTVRAFAVPTSGDVTDQLEQYGDWKVAKAEAVGIDDLYLNATPDGSWPFPQGGPIEHAEC